MLQLLWKAKSYADNIYSEEQTLVKYLCALLCDIELWCHLSIIFQLRAALDKIEELQMSNFHLEKRLERIRATRAAMSMT